MSKEIQVLDVKVNNYTAKEAMQLAMEYMQKETLQVIERVTPESLKQLSEHMKCKEQMGTFDITFAGSKVLLEAAGVKDEQLLKEAESQLFMKLFWNFLSKNRKKVFLLAENEALLSKLYEFLHERYSKIKILDVATFEENGISDDMILNRINGMEADCIIAALSSPLQEEFVLRYRNLLNARVWLGIGVHLNTKETKFSFKRVKEFLIRQVLKKEIENVKKN